MQINRCISCENEISGYPCPHCGFDAASYQQPEYALPCDTVLHGRYLIGKVLGQGGFGITYVGWDLALEIKVAVKEYYPSGQVYRSSSMGRNLLWNTGEQALELRQNGLNAFLREARKMAKVGEIPQVIRAKDTFTENDTAYIVMDFVEGENLKKRLDRTGCMTWPEVRKIFLPVIAAMEQVHQAGLVHRDLSPDNLMLAPDGRAWILDLGAAKDLATGSGASSVQVVKGGFSPVEQYGQAGSSGSWTDVYAMAATMYFSLTGVLPPPAIDRLYDDRLSWDLPQLAAVPKNVVSALKKAMAINLNERTQTMGQLLNNLQSTKSPEHVPRPAIKWGVCALAVLLVAAGLYAGLAKKPGAASQEPPVLQQAPTTSQTFPKDTEPQELTLPLTEPSAETRQTQPAAIEPTLSDFQVGGSCGQNAYWTLDEAGVLTISGTGAMWDYEYFEENNRPSVESPWDEDRKSVLSVRVEDGITHIGEHAFAFCGNLKNVEIAQSVTSMGKNVFRDCDDLTSVVLPDGIIKLERDIFYHCDRLTEVTLPKNLVGIMAGVFRYCGNLDTITIPNSVSQIGEMAFAGTKLESVTINQDCKLGYAVFPNSCQIMYY